MEAFLARKPYFLPVLAQSDDEDGTAYVAIIALEYDEDEFIALADVLDFDVSMISHVTSNEPGLANVFNAGVYNVPAGQVLEPYVTEFQNDKTHSYMYTASVHTVTKDGLRDILTPYIHIVPVSEKPQAPS